MMAARSGGAPTRTSTAEVSISASGATTTAGRCGAANDITVSAQGAESPAIISSSGASLMARDLSTGLSCKEAAVMTKTNF